MKSIDALKALDQTLNALSFSENLIFWDAATLAPKKAVNGRSIALTELSELSYNLLVNENTLNILEDLESIQSSLNPSEKALLKFYRDSYDQIACVPVKEYAAFKGLQAQSSKAWEDAKEANDFSIFEPFLQKVIDYKRAYVQYRNKPGHPYDVLLDDFETDLTVEIADVFFAELKATIVPLVAQIKDKKMPIPALFDQVKFDLKGQEAFSKKLMALLAFDEDAGIIAESVHPFTMNITPDDVRITTHYYEDNILSSIYSTIHECGHGLYEQHISKDLGFSRLATGTTMGIHESQSRIYENNIGRSIHFWSAHFDHLKTTFPEQLEGYRYEDAYRAANDVKPSLIRIEADELTYGLHIMVRYELEKRIIEGTLNAKDLPETWNDLYESYLGIRPESDAVGVLQDVHWSEGLFGYFPSYALGSAYASQFEHAMNQKFDFGAQVASGDLTQISQWLRDNIHQYGCTKSPKEILLDATGEPFNPKYFTTYLKNKFSKLYDLD